MSDANARAGSGATVSSSSSSSSPSSPSSSSDWNDAVDTIKRHKLRVVGGIWACGMVGAFAFQSFGARAATKQTSVKIIHSRLYAQFATLSALVLGAGVEMIDRSAPARAAVPDADAALEYAATHRARATARTANASNA
uniref:HIG1 domain-containing protein n=1 Tax=Ostreococcus mediterraneus TaxID=1486918 RepID=A0A6T5Z8H3_9CHLO